MDIFLIIIIVGLQIVFFLTTKKDCSKLSNLFPPRLGSGNKPLLIIQESILDRSNKQIISSADLGENYDEDNIEYVSLIALDTREQNIHPEFRSILTTTNHYLKNNVETTAEFNILRDIAERVSDSEEMKIDATISLPLYIGLMGTFAGVIFGIFNILAQSSLGNESVITDASINGFLGGVLVAMIGSFFGLILTTYNNSYFFKKAKAQRDSLKNIYLNFLQAELLPTLENTLGNNLNEFKNNLTAFNDEFSVNIRDFKGTIPMITDNLKLQTDFIKSFNQIDIPRLAQANVKIFDKLNESAEIFKQFNRYANNLSKQYSAADEMLEKINQLMNRLVNFENNINDIGVLIKESDKNYVKVGEYIVEKLSALKDRYQLITEFVDKSEDEVKTISNEYVNRIKATSQRLEQEFDKTFDFTNQNNPFAKLELLEKVNKNLETIALKIENQTKLSTKPDNKENLMEAIIELTTSIKLLKKSIRPSMFKPIQFFKFVFSKNGYN